MTQLSLYTNDLIGVLIIYQGLLFLFNLFSNQSRNTRFNVILALLISCLTLNFLNMLLINQAVTGLNLGAFFGLSYGPLCTLYTRSLIYKDHNLSLKDWLHFVPAVIALISLLILPEKALIVVSYPVFTLLVVLHIGTYLVWAYRQVTWFRKKLKHLVSEVVSANLSWLQYLILGIGLIFLVVLAESFLSNDPGLNNAIVLMIYAFVLLFLNSIYWKGIKQPRIFAGISKQDESTFTEVDKRYSHSNLTEQEAQQYLEQLETYMLEEKPYLVYNLTIEQLAEATGIKSRYLSQVVNQMAGKNFYDFVNSYRIEAAKKLLADAEADLRINEVMYDTGFNSKSTFNGVFRKATGLTPSEYRKKVLKK